MHDKKGTETWHCRDDDACGRGVLDIACALSRGPGTGYFVIWSGLTRMLALATDATISMWMDSGEIVSTLHSLLLRAGVARLAAGGTERYRA
tara:strand:- start:64 stop:339 length:276 start_codon:yes stop_codon:yes gene_type:complete